MSNSVIFLDSGELNGEEARRQVRSRAAQHSHRIGPRKPKVSKKLISNWDKDTGIFKPGSSSTESSRRGSTVSLTTSTSNNTPRDDEGGVVWSLNTVSQSPPIARFGRGRHADDPFESYPVPAQAWFPQVMDCMWPFMQRGWKVLRTTQAQRDEAIVWVQRLTMNDPCYFYMNVFSVSDDLVSRGLLNPRNLVWLAGQIVATINEALSDTSRALAVGTVLAVGRLALREIFVGDMNAGVTFHRPAFARMIVLAGGLDRLGLPSLVREHIGWANRMITQKTGINVSHLEPMLANEITFGVQRHEHDDNRVLDTYLPYRQKLRLADKRREEEADVAKELIPSPVRVKGSKEATAQEYGKDN